MNVSRRCLLLPCALIGTISFAHTAAAETSADVPVLTHTVVLSKLESPWDMAFLPDGTMFFTEKCKGLSVRTADGKVNPLLGMKDSKGYADTAADLFCEGQAGMQGVTADPDFAKNRLIYVYSTSSMTEPGTNRVLRLKVSDDFGKVSDRTDIVADIPLQAESKRSSVRRPRRTQRRPSAFQPRRRIPLRDDR